ncbi:DNA gyrase inhibitor YacG [bacterium]|nr:DNA gyrase inhibitor YacG [bacterium]
MADASPPARPCPACRRPTRWAGNPHRPFCSERCRMADLGAWAAERYRVPGEAISEDDDTGTTTR